MTSAKISAAIRAGLPHFDASPKATEPITLPDGVILLPELKVAGKKIRVPSENETLSKEELLKKIYPGANLKGAAAAVAYRDLMRLHHMKELNDVAETLDRAGRDGDAKQLRKEIRDTFIRRPSWEEEALDKNYNLGRR